MYREEGAVVKLPDHLLLKKKRINDDYKTCGAYANFSITSLTDDEIPDLDILNITDDASEGYIVEVDLEFQCVLHECHKFPAIFLAQFLH